MICMEDLITIMRRLHISFRSVIDSRLDGSCVEKRCCRQELDINQRDEVRRGRIGKQARIAATGKS
jgi:hypothetical protein